MKDKRNIDQLFKSQLDDLQVSPPPEVWDRIEAKLQKKRDRKVIPLWWKLGGVAALLAILLTIGNGLFTSNTDLPIVTEDPSVVNPLENQIETIDLMENEREKGIVDSETPSIAPDDETDPLKDKKSTIDKTRHEGTPLADGESLKKDRSTLSKKGMNDTKDHVYGVAQTGVQDVKKNTRSQEPRKMLPSEKSETQKSGIALTDVLKEDKAMPSEEDRVMPSRESQEKGIAQEDFEKEKGKAEEPSVEKKSIFDAIEENKKEAIAQSEKKEMGGWEVTPNVGPVYYNSLNGGSSIDPIFADNSQNGEVNFSYGVQVAYVINDRFSVRSGVNNVNVGYSTGGIEVASGPASFGLKSVTYDNPNRDVLTVFDKGTVPAMADPNDPYSQLNLKSTSGNAEIRQSITYYEVPLEAKYALVNNRFGINMIGGFSTLLLGDSEVSVNDNGFRSVLGEANNLNSVSFSTNIGLGFDYKINKRFKLNVEPIFKYQLNPYSDSSVDFNPYYFGIYSGLSFKF